MVLCSQLMLLHHLEADKYTYMDVVALVVWPSNCMPCFTGERIVQPCKSVDPRSVDSLSTHLCVKSVQL